MAIVTVTELKATFDSMRVEQLASDMSATVGKPVYDETNISGILTQAEGIIKLALSRQYTTAEIEADDGIKRVCLDIAMYFLECRKGNPSQVMVEAYQRAQQILRDLQEGIAKLAAVGQLLPSITTDNSSDALEMTDMGYFDGIMDSDNHDND